uniref:Transmembrane protein n=1 Tax=Mycena chlorophos TaxID=658473 RepID=A0ABQ0M6V7_MYCCL|nr:predicted protein [Mycena chlorophos]
MSVGYFWSDLDAVFPQSYVSPQSQYSSANNAQTSRLSARAAPVDSTVEIVTLSVCFALAIVVILIGIVYLIQEKSAPKKQSRTSYAPAPQVYVHEKPLPTRPSSTGSGSHARFDDSEHALLLLRAISPAHTRQASGAPDPLIVIRPPPVAEPAVAAAVSAEQPLLSPLQKSQLPGFIPRPLPFNIPVSVAPSDVTSIRSGLTQQTHNRHGHGRRHSGMTGSPEELDEVAEQLKSYYVLAANHNATNPGGLAPGSLARTHTRSTSWTARSRDDWL